MAPQGPVLAGEGQVELTRSGSPRVGAVSLAHLDDVLALGVVVDHPVKAVGAHVHEPSAALDVGVHRVEHLLGVVLGVRAGEHDPVGPDRVGALVMEVLVGDDVELVARW